MYSVTVTMSVQPGQEATFEALMKGLAENVHANEPDNVAYHILRVRNEPTKYRVVEIYRSKDAFKVHLGAPYIQKANPDVLKTLSAPPEIEATEVVA